MKHKYVLSEQLPLFRLVCLEKSIHIYLKPLRLKAKDSKKLLNFQLMSIGEGMILLIFMLNI